MTGHIPSHPTGAPYKGALFAVETTATARHPHIRATA